MRISKIVAVMSLAFSCCVTTFASTSTRKAVENLMRSNPPRLTYSTTMSADSLPGWRAQMSETMRRLMRHPQESAAAPRKIMTRQRDGYRIERWESYPLPEDTVAFYVLIPDSLSGATASVLCIPGFGQTKELLAGECAGNYMLDGERDVDVTREGMARQYAKRGLVAVAVDNPSSGELSDNKYFDYLASSRFLLELGWSYLGLASWQDKVILDWMKEQPWARRDRIIVSGFSLGTEPLMALGLLDKEIYAFVYNDFLCRTRERALTMNAPSKSGERAFPNSIEHLIPEFLTEFDFPDIVAALSPRPVICTEGGLDRDFEIIKDAYKKSGAPEAFEYHHYAKFADPANRAMITEMPNGITRGEFFRLANVDPPHHYFKSEWVMPWLDKVLAE